STIGPPTSRWGFIGKKHWRQKAGGRCNAARRDSGHGLLHCRAVGTHPSPDMIVRRSHARKIPHLLGDRLIGIFRRRTMSIRSKSALMIAVLAVSLASAAHATDRYPSKPVRIIVPVTAGGGVDTITRLLATHMGE